MIKVFTVIIITVTNNKRVLMAIGLVIRRSIRES